MLQAADLAQATLFKGLPEKELKSAAAAMKEVTIPAGKEVSITGQSGVAFSVILEGEAEVRTVDGRTRRLNPGDHFGEMALLEGEGRSADVTAASDLRLAALVEWGFKDFLARHPEVAFRLLQTLSRRLREAEAAHR
ncbi:MAG TPA: cyclic nucleotide-binding domain-containing protein [Candidatus Dormibacteraeota bacterium]